MCLASQRDLETPADPVASRSAALRALNEVPRAIDAQGVVCSWHAPSQAIVVRSAHLPDAAIALALDAVPTDLCVGGDGVLYVALPGRVLMHDLRRRWADVEVTEQGFAPWRLAGESGNPVKTLRMKTPGTPPVMLPPWQFMQLSVRSRWMRSRSGRSGSRP